MAPPAKIIFSSKTSKSKALVRPPTLYGPLSLQLDLDIAVDFGKVFAKIISFFLIFLGTSPVSGSANRNLSQTSRSAGLSEA